mmetsp:Transcript_72643/g.183916  ORF Transcript_72643/g.183916 Transcript_72643/m.183916 type:complete len:103 (-) Transcript_72643:79-387(-)
MRILLFDCESLALRCRTQTCTSWHIFQFRVACCWAGNQRLPGIEPSEHGRKNQALLQQAWHISHATGNYINLALMDGIVWRSANDIPTGDKQTQATTLVRLL